MKSLTRPGGLQDPNDLFETSLSNQIADRLRSGDRRLRRAD